MHYDGHVCAVFLRSDERGIFRFHIEMGRGIAAICVFDASLEKKRGSRFSGRDEQLPGSLHGRGS